MVEAATSQSPEVVSRVCASKEQHVPLTVEQGKSLTTVQTKVVE